MCTPMKTKKSERMNDLIQAIGDLAKVQTQLTRQAERQYASEVEAIRRDQSRDPQRINHILDGILDFCFDPGMLCLFKKLCHYYFKIDPEATASYVNTYREMWDEIEEEK
jgi:hypothetical protein